MVHSSQQVLEKNQARNLAYVHKHFLSFDDLVMQSGHSEEKVRSLLTAQAAPGVIYAFDEEKGWWSALGSYWESRKKAPRTKEKNGTHRLASGGYAVLFFICVRGKVLKKQRRAMLVFYI